MNDGKFINYKAHWNITLARNKFMISTCPSKKYNRLKTEGLENKLLNQMHWYQYKKTETLFKLFNLCCKFK